MAQRRTSTLQENIFADRWFHFEAYEIKDDYIRPAANAKLIEFEPWKEFLAPHGKEAMRQPYHSLLELAPHLHFDRLGRLEGDGEKRVVDWCAQNGLLGLLLHRVETVILPAETRLVAAVNPSSPSSFTTIFERTNRGWSVIDAFDLPRMPIKPGVFIRKKLGGFQMTFEPLEKTYGTFFPNVPAAERHKYQYPTPFKKEFWFQYCEPLGQFVRAVRDLRSAVDSLRNVGKRAASDEECFRAERLLNAFSLPVRPLLYTDGKRRSVGWACHSLLASFAMMASLDLARTRVLECANPSCRRIFVSNAAQARYCTNTCRGTVQVRKRRKLQEQALRLARRGLSCAEIAAKLRKEPSLVFEWATKWRQTVGLSVPLHNT